MYVRPTHIRVVQKVLCDSKLYRAELEVLQSAVSNIVEFRHLAELYEAQIAIYTPKRC